MKTCDICKCVDKSKLGIFVHECADGVYRCKKCRQLAVYGQVFHHDDDEFEAHKAGLGSEQFNIA